MSNKDSSNSQDSVSTPTLSKKSITLLLGLLVERLKDLEKKQRSEQLFLMLTVTFMAVQFIVLVTLSIVVSPKLEKTSIFQMAPNTLEEKLETQKENGNIVPKNIDM